MDLVQWIKRARSLPLTLHMIFCDIDRMFFDQRKSLAPVVSVLNDYATNWKTLYFQTPHEGSRMLGSLLPHLFCFDGWHSLRRICLGKSAALLQNRTIPLAQLTHLEIYTQTSYQEAMNVCRICSKLVQLSIFVLDPPYPVMATDCVTLRDLVTFSLKSYGSSAVLEGLSLPSLRDLRIGQLYITDVPSLLAFFTRSSCTLDTLELHEWEFQPKHYLSFLAHKSCNLLTSLRICSAGRIAFDAEVLRRLTLHQHDSLCPHLKFLKIDCCVQSSSSALLKMVESRINPHADQEQLQHFRFWIGFGHDIDIKELDEFGEKNGMEYNRQWVGVNLELVSLWRFGSGFGKTDLRDSRRDNVYL